MTWEILGSPACRYWIRYEELEIKDKLKLSI